MDDRLREESYDQITASVTAGEDSVRTRDTRVLTPDGQGLYLEQLEKLNAKEDKVWSHIETQLTDLKEKALDIKSLRRVKADIQHCKKEHYEISNKVLTFLEQTKTEESKTELEYQEERFKRKWAMITRVQRQIDETLLEKAETASLSEMYSKSSSNSSIIRKKKMEAQIEKTRLESIKREMDLKQEKFKIEGQLQILKQSEKTAIAEAEARVLEEAEGSASSRSALSSLESISKTQQVTNYLSGLAVDDNIGITDVNLYSHVTDSSTFPPSGTTNQTSHTALHVPPHWTPHTKDNSGLPTPSKITAPTWSLQPPLFTPASVVTEQKASFSPTVTLMNNRMSTLPCMTSVTDKPIMTNTLGASPAQLPDHMTAFSNYLIKKELMVTRFTNFNDEPESYNAWKVNFKSVVKELSISPFEEIQLLVRWLGPGSSKFASNLRQANADNPVEGLHMIWTRLDDRYGAAELIDCSLKGKLNSFPSLGVKDNKRLFELVDILSQIDSLKRNPSYSTMFSYYDSSVGILPIVSKLPHQWREKWTTKASAFKSKYDVPYPPFSIFVQFIQELSRIRNDPGFQYQDNNGPKKGAVKPVHVKKTDVDPAKKVNQGTKDSKKCPLHSDQFHSLKQCRKFRSLPIGDRKKILKEHNLCYRCCDASHLARNCKVKLSCDICAEENHHTALHSPPKDGGEKSKLKGAGTVDNMCTMICGDNFPGKSCAKTLLVNIYPAGSKHQSRRLYAILDDQSSQTLARPGFFNMFGINGGTINYNLSSCSGTVSMTGRSGSNFVVEPVDGGQTINLSRVIECEDIPNSKEEIPSPQIARAYPHLAGIAKEIHEIDENAEILLLIGRDHPDVHHVLSQKTGPPGSPFAQKLPLGWAIIGECCLGKVHPPATVVANKTHILPSGQGTTFRPCPTHLSVNETCYGMDQVFDRDSIFERTREDNQPGLSVEDREFLQIMDNECHRDKDGHWTAPLPFRKDRSRLPNNRDQAVKRMHALTSSFKKNSTKQDHALSFMDRMLKNGHAERAPPLEEEEECWFLPIFGVYHPRKPTQIRMVFDASASFEGTSLNSTLLPGPNMINSLLGILLRFRKENVAVVGDIEQMFYAFRIRKDHRNFVRFVWFEDNNPQKPLVDYRMCVHLFGNSPSPAVATYCLRKCVSEGSCDQDIRDFVSNNFYVDDGLASFPTTKEALDVLTRTQDTLMEQGKLRFHKFASNDQDVIDALQPEDRAKDLNDINMDLSSAPTQRSLGLNWNLQSDCFVFQFLPNTEHVTKRRILSCLNSLYDPLGFISPVILQGRFVFRDVVNSTIGWDEIVSQEIETRWKNWCNSLHHLSDVKIPRTFVPVSLKESDRIELHVFSDASEKAVSAVAFLRVISHGDTFVGFAFGKSKLAPHHGHTVPRLELCAALLGTEIATIVSKELDVIIDEVKFYTDSRVVLGYIYNKIKRFHTYVSNRVQRIHLVSRAEQWNYVSSDKNPADVGTRSCMANELYEGTWLTGPTFLYDNTCLEEDLSYPLQNPDNDKEIRLDTAKTAVTCSLGLARFDRFSSWVSAVRALAVLKCCIMRKHGHYPKESSELYRSSEIYLVKILQQEKFGREIANLSKQKPVPKDSPLRFLDPYLDDDSVIRVGGRLQTGDALSGKHGPMIIPGKTHLSRLIVLHHHEKLRHQGRNITNGAIRSAGYWIIGAKRLVTSVIHSCVTCRKLRRKLECQKMANLPEFRTKPTPPFTYVGVDAFGPWEVSTRRTRGGAANSKRWAILFTCMTSRAAHIELVEEMSSASFINALRRFVSLRGKVTEFHSDRGTNFVGSTDALGINTVNVEVPAMKKFLRGNGCIWVFNPPHASHMGGVWERIIGLARRILEGIIVTESKKNLTHDVLNTFMCEVCAIINSRPIVPVSVDPSQPSVLSPSALLTQKTDIDIGPFEQIDIKDAYRSCWKHAQVLANQFWRRWQNEYLQALQTRRKWRDSKDNIKTGDVVLMRDESTARYEWPLGVVLRCFPSEDSRVRKVELNVIRNGQRVVYVRPVTQLVHLFSP